MGWKQISRRRMLQGSGALIGIPVLEAMFPMRQALAQAMTAPLRTMIVNWSYGCYRDSLNPTGTGTNYNFSTWQSALQPYRASITPIRRIFNYWGNVDADGDGDHARGQGTYLTCVRINKSETDIRNSISADQMIANAIGSQTRVKSAFFSGERDYYGDSGYGSVYMNLSWLNSTTPNSKMGDPHQVFDALLAGAGGGGNSSATLLRLKKQKSILDGAVADVNRLMGTLGSTDKQKLDQYLTSVREVETRIARDLAAQGSTGAACTPGTRPPTNQNFQTRTRLFFDIMVLAAQCDATRTFVYHMGSPYDFGPINGVSGDHHNDYSHHKDNASAINGLQRIAQWYCEQFAYFMNKMNTTLDADGKTLLHNSIVTYGAEMRDSNAHDDYDIPILVAGNAGGKFTPGRLLDPGANTPMANVWLTIMKAMGVNVNSFGEGQGASTGTLAL